MGKNIKFSIAMIVVLLLLTITTPKLVSAESGCTCVQYIKNSFGITETTGNAYQMGTWLLNHGFAQISSPQVGALAVMQPSFPGANTTYGHVGIIVAVSDFGTQWQITLRGASQKVGGSLFSQYRCNNVRNTVWSKYSKTASGIKYYIARPMALRSALTKPGFANSYITVDHGLTNSGANLLGAAYNGADAQLFYFIKYGSDYRIIARHTGMCIQPSSTNYGANVVQKVCAGKDIEKWQWIYMGNGYMIKNTLTGYVADLKESSLTPGTPILAWGSRATNNLNQRWWRELK